MGTPVTDPDLIAKLEAAASGARVPVAAPPPVTRKNRAPGQYRSYRSQASIDAEGGGGTPGRGGVTDPKVVAELNDRAKAQELGVDYDTVAKSRDAQIAKEATGSIFPAVDKDVSGSKTQAFLKGIIGDPAAAITQFGLRAGHDVQKAIGLDPNSGSGVFSDAQVAYQAAAEKAREQEYQQGRERQGRGGFDVTRLAGAIAQPYIPGGGGATVVGRVGRAALQGAAGSALQQTDVAPDESYWAKKAGEVGAGSIFGVGLHGAGAAVRGVGRAVKPTTLEGPTLREARDAAKRLNVDVGVANITRSRPIARGADIAASLPLGSSLISGAQKAEKGLGQSLEDVSQGFGGTARTKGEVGQAAVSGIEGHVERVKDKANQLFADIDRNAPQYASPNRTLGQLQNTFTKFTNPALGRELQNTKLLEISHAIQSGTVSSRGPSQMTFKDLQQLRSEVGAMMSKPSLIADIPQGELKQVYGAITADMKTALQNSGNPNALRSFDKANKFWNYNRDVIDNTLEKITGGGKLSHEQVADKIALMGTKDAQGLRHLRRSLQPGEWDNIASGTFNRLGQIKPSGADFEGAGFSPSKFLENFNSISQNKPAFNALFGGTRYAANVQKYKDMALLADRLKGNQKLANHSGTSLSNNIVTMVMGIANPVIWKGLAGSAVYAKAMSSPKFLDFYLDTGAKLGRAGRIPGRAGKRAIETVSRAQYARLAGMAAHDSSMADVMATLAGNNPQQPQQ